MSRATLDKDFLGGFANVQAELARRGPAWLRATRRDARARFDEHGLPTTRVEEWKHTNVASLARHAFGPGNGKLAEADLPALAATELGGPRLVFVDGRIAPALCRTSALPEGVRVVSLAQALEQPDGELEPHLGRNPSAETTVFRSLNTALAVDGALIRVPRGLSLDDPLQLIYVTTSSGTPTASHPRTLILAEADSRVTVVESYHGPTEGVYWTNAVTEIVVGDNASVEHYRVQDEGPQAFHLASTESRQNRDSRLSSHSFNLGGRLVRHDVLALLDGEGGHCTMNGLTLTRDSQHVDNHTVIDHAKPHCDSRELFKGILADRSRSVFKGRIIVRPDAQQTDAKQSNPNLLLSDGALANSLPQLEIYADDVKCTHGATIGRLDEEAVFYLRSRGITESDARRLLVSAFAGEVLDLVELEPLREALTRVVEARLPQAGGDVDRR